MNELELIARTCIKDQRLYEIVENVSKMSEDEKTEFRAKVKKYFLSRNSPEDTEAYNFFMIVTEEDNSKKVLEIYNFLLK